MSTLHESLHGKKYREEDEELEPAPSSRTRKNPGNPKFRETKFWKIPSALKLMGNLWIFFLTLTFLLGLSCYAVGYSVVFHHLQLNWQYPDSGYLTQINSLDIDAMVKQLAREGLDSGKYCLDQRDGDIKLSGNCKTLTDLANEEKTSSKRK